MKKIDSVSSSKAVISLLSGVKSRITTYLPRVYHVIAPMLFVAFGLFGVNESAWGQLPYNTTMTKDHYNNSSINVGNDGASYSQNKWDGGIYLAAKKSWVRGTEWNWDDKYVIIALKTNSIPYQLKFKYKCNSIIASNPDWYVAESSDKSNWTTIWSTESNSTSTSALQTVDLSKSTKYIKLCYSGNYGGTYSDIKVTDQKYVHNPKVGDNEISSLDFGSGTISSGKAELSFDVEWCNVSALSVTSSNTTYFTVSPASFGNTAKYGTQTVTVYYDRDVAVGNNHSGTITISNGNATYTKTVSVNGTTTKRPQEIHWNASLAAVNYTLNAEESLTGSAIATADKEDAVITYTSSNENVIAVSPDKKTLMAISTGTADITASATGDDIYAVGTDTKTFTVTSKKKQTITWNRNLMGLKTNANPDTVHLSATATSNGTITYSIEAGSDGCITLGGTNNSVMTITGTPGTAYIKATQAGGVIGGEDWIAATAIKQVKVRNPNSSCDEYAISDESFAFSSGDKTSMSEKVFNLTGKPTTLTFKAKRGGLKFLWSEQKDLYIEQYANFGSGLEWKQVEAIQPGTSENTYGPYPLEETATKIRFRSGEYAEQQVYNITSARETIFDVSEPSITDDAERNVKWSKTISVTRSNIDVLDISVTSDDSSCPFQLSKTSLGTDCADMSTETFEVFFTPTTKNKTYIGTITITDGKASNTHTATIPLSVKTVAFNQAITWNFTDNQEFPTTNVPLVFNATTDATGLEVSYRVADEDADKATIDGNTLTIIGSGSIQVIAYQEGDDKYNEAPEITKTIIANKVTPNITTKPTVATIKYLDNLNNNQLSEGLATVTLHGVANTAVAGAFEWTNTKQITDKAGDYTHSITFNPTNTGMYNNKVFDQTITISRADASIVMNDGSVKVSIAGVNDDLDECKIDLDGLIASQTTDAIAASRAGAVSYKVISGNAEYASIDGNHVFSATRCGEYTIEVTKAQTEWYEEAKDTFKVAVNKLDPVVVFDNTDNPQVIYTYDELIQPAARWYNGHEISRAIVYTSAEQKIVEVNNSSSKLTAKEVGNKEEGEYSLVTVSAYSVEDDFYNESAATEKHYEVHAKRSPVFEMDDVENAPVSKTLNIGETAIIRYNDFTDATLTVGTSGEHGYVTFELNRETREVTITAVKGNLTGDGTQIITLTQPGNDDYYERQINYTFTVRRNVSTMSVEALPDNMQVEDTVSTIFTNLANTTDAIQFSCTPEGGMKMEDGKLIALQAGQYTVTFTQPNTEYWTGISQSKTITVSKINPQITWFSETSEPWYATVRNPFRSTNTMNDCPITVTSSDETLAKYIAEDNKIVVYGTSGTVTFTLNQQGNYKYNPVVNAQKTITIFKPNNGLPFTLTSSNWTNYKNSNEGAISWDNGGVLCGEASGIGLGGAGWDWNPKYIILKFVGIPDTLSFDFQNANSVATQYGWHFYQSSTGNDNDWQVLKEYADALMNSDGGTSEGSEKLALHPDTRYLKLEYHGNFGGRFKNVSVTERKEITPQRATEDFGLGYNGNEPTDHILPVDWYNVNSCRVYIDGADADRFILTENTIYSNLNEYGTANLHVSYKHDANTATSHTATLYIVEELPNGKDGKTAQIALVGQTQPAPQVIIWRDDLTPMPSEGDFPGAAYSTSGLAITLTSLNPDIVRVGGEDGLTLYPVAAGIAQVQAYQAGNEKWAEVTDVLEIEVTNKQVQFITWNDNLSNLKREDGKTVTVTLHATASSNLEVTYELDEAASEFASVNGNVLTLTGWGTGTITAKQAGNADFVAVSKKKTLVSRNPNAGCRPLVGEYADEYTLHTIAFKEIELNGEPQTVEFDAKCDATALNGLLVAEFYDNYWHEIARIKRLEGNTITSSYKHFGPYDLHRTTTAVKIYTETGATMTRKFKNVEVTLAKYLELDRNEMNFSQMDMGATKIQSFYINYSNLTGALDVQLENSSEQFEVITTTVGEDCGDYAKNVRIDIMCTGKTAGLEENVIIVSNVNQTLRVPVSANVLKPTQAITWEPETNILTTDEVILAATATSELAVTYESKQPEIAEVVWNGEAWKLDIKKYGDVTITASQTGNESWSAATDKEITFHISRVVPTITEYPTADAIMLSFPLGGCALHGGAIAEDIQGSFRWADEEQIVTRETNIYQAMFAPDNQNYYAPVPFDIELEAIEDTQFITWDREEETYAHCTDVIELEAVASSGLPIMYHSSDSLVAYVENGILKVIQAGTVTIQATQPGNIRYAAAEPISKQITLERNTLEVEKAPTASYVYVGHMLSDAKFENDGIVKAGDIVVDGTFTWEMDEKMPILGTYSRTAIFTPNNINWYIPTSCMVSVQVVSAYSYIGNGGWTLNKDYWRDGKRPDGDETPDDVAVEGTLTVTADDIIKVRDLNVSGTIILEEGARMTVTGNLVLEASLGGMDEDENVYPATSGQLIGDVFESIDVQGDVYFQISLDPSGQCSPGWYDFTVPFPVDVMTGITRLDNTTGEEKEIKNEVNYAIMDFSESRHIESHYGWKKFRGIMQPGQCYTITIDDIDNVYRFKKTTTGSFNNQKEEALAYTDSEVTYRGWNGLGNGTMSHVDLSAVGISEVQIYNHLSNSYMPVDIDEFTYVVGASYFIQAPAANSILTYSEGTKSAEWYRAPKRNVGEGENKEFKLTLTREGSTHEADRLYIGATEDASDSYEIGRDLSKFGNPLESKVAQVWANAYGMKLCDIDMPLINDEASCPISLFAPKAGVYALEVKRAQDDADLYLTYNGEVIWDLTMSEYEFELSKGLTDGYGLKMVSHAPKVATGVDNADAESATMRKVIINDKIYVITPEGKMYDIVGKSVKY